MRIFQKPLAIFSLLTILAFLISVSFIALKFQSLPEEIILQFNHTEGVKTFGAKTDLIGILAMSGAILALNFLLAETLFYRDRVLTIIFLASNLILSILTLTIISLLISVN